MQINPYLSFDGECETAADFMSAGLAVLPIIYSAANIALLFQNLACF